MAYRETIISGIAVAIYKGWFREHKKFNRGAWERPKRMAAAQARAAQWGDHPNVQGLFRDDVVPVDGEEHKHFPPALAA